MANVKISGIVKHISVEQIMSEIVSVMFLIRIWCRFFIVIRALARTL